MLALSPPPFRPLVSEFSLPCNLLTIFFCLRMAPDAMGFGKSERMDKCAGQMAKVVVGVLRGTAKDAERASKAHSKHIVTTQHNT